MNKAKVETEEVLMVEKKEEEQEIAKPFGFNKKWLLVGLLVAFLNPIIAGLVLGAAYLSEPGLKKEGRIVTVVALIWGALMLFIFRKYFFLFLNQ